MKKVAGKLKLELAQFDDLQAFAHSLLTSTKRLKTTRRGARLRKSWNSPNTRLCLYRASSFSIRRSERLSRWLTRNKVFGYTAALREYLKTSKPAYAQTIKDNKMQLTDEAEALLKEANAECKKSFLAAA